jgi:hypothetical protein
MMLTIDDEISFGAKLSEDSVLTRDELLIAEERTSGSTATGAGLYRGSR